MIYGWSLGAAVAVDLASRVPPAAMILEGAPASLVDLAARRYPFFPLRFFMRSSFDSIEKIGGIPAPILFLHSTDDEVIPISEGRRLMKRRAAQRCSWNCGAATGGHRTVGSGVLERAIRAFLGTYGPGRLQ